MTRLMALAGLLLCLAQPAQAGAQDCENGGIIILRSHYSVVVDSDQGQTMIIVASAREIASIQARIAASDKPVTFRLKDTHIDMRLRRVDSSRLTGRLHDGRRVLVMTRAYAEKHGYY